MAKEKPKKDRNPRIPTKPFREAVEREGISFTRVAERIGWWDKSGRLDGSRVACMLRRETMQEYNAVKFCRALHIDPVDIGF